MRYILLTFMLMSLLIPALSASSLSADDLRFLLDKEQFELIQKYETDFLSLADSPLKSERQLILEYAQRTDRIALAMDMHYRIARDFASLEDALQWLILQSLSSLEIEDLQLQHAVLSRSFETKADSLVFAHYSMGDEADEILDKIQELPAYNDVIEASAKSVLDEIATQASSHEALELIDAFYQSYPASGWHQAAYYYQMYHLSQLGDYPQLAELMLEQQRKSPAHAYITAIYLCSPSFRREAQNGVQNIAFLNQARQNLEFASQADSATVLFDAFIGEHWQNKIKLLDSKARYYLSLASASPEGYYGDEEDLIAVFEKPNSEQLETVAQLSQISFEQNDQGELAELHFWRGKLKSLFSGRKHLEAAIRDFGQCLIYGAPRRRFDSDAQVYISDLLAHLQISSSPIEYLRQIYDYNGIVFEDTHSFDDHRYTRVAIADYDNDGLLDLLFNGRYLYHNDGDFKFSPHPDSSMSQRLNTNGGIWADFNKDGDLDFAAISHSVIEPGDALMKQNPDHSFVRVNARAGDIDDRMPSEGIAFIDIDHSGYPSLYVANYEKWQERSGYPDRFWQNDASFFRDRSTERGFLLPAYTDNPGLAGRGVAPADFDNDGKQEILVTNYRLNRNFLFKQADSLFVDVASLYGVAGNYKNGYYGHSIGADWGDIDNDGDLDLIICNLAHPRFIDISDITQLLRNDGLTHRVVASDTLYYWQFTDITTESGISYDEMHVEPLFFDADNDGFLDLYITSVYQNDRSYLYHNNGDGTFTDITYLSGARVYNGWSCAAGDLNRDGLLDLVIGSGNGTKILSNVTETQNRAVYLKPVFRGNHTDLISICEEMPPHPNSPAFGARVMMKVTHRDGNTRTLMRELSSAKGSSTQSAPELHFGLNQGEIISYELWRKAQ